MCDAVYPMLTSMMPALRHGIHRLSINCFHRASIRCRRPSWKQKGKSGEVGKMLISFGKFGAGEGIRTLDPNLGKVVLYP
jgi:hypothetical protein